MLFNSLQYLVFFSIVATVYFLFPHRHRWSLLLAASYYFYMCWKAEYVLLIFASTASVYAAGLFISRNIGSPKSRWALTVTLLFNLCILFVFKYYNFFNDSVRAVLDYFNILYNAPKLKLLLPVGISFYTFQVISYLADVYKGEREAERHLGHFALFVAFFPKLVAGPIERAGNLLPQLKEKYEFDYQRVTDGLKLISWGLFKKMVIADRLALYVDGVYNNAGSFSGAPVFLATVFYAFQIYCDFSGYTDIARGSARIFGFRLMKNFDNPYYSASISEFWRRWHISLSTWLEDYIYLPILISKRTWGMTAIVFALLVTFFVSGLWHGAAWTFIIWGMLHGFMLSLEVVTKKGRKKIKKAVPAKLYHAISVFLTFLFVCFTYIFFRANSVSDAFVLIGAMFDFSDLNIIIPQMNKIELVVAFFSIAILESVQLVQRRMRLRQFIAQKGLLFRWPVYIAFVSYILFFRTSGAQFIYFQF